MSSEVVSDENQGALAVHKQVPSESAADIFALDHSTGRPSILRPSQAENVAKNIPKGVKVCFRTPLRDHVTKRIMSPSHVGRMATLDDCTNALEYLTLKSPTPHGASTIQIDVPVKMSISKGYDDMPIQSRGGYSIDFDNLDSVKPFQSSSKMILSPSKPAAPPSDTPPLMKLAAPAASPASEEVERVGEKADVALDETLPFIPSVEYSLADLSADGAFTDSTVIIEPRKTPLVDCSADDTVNIEVPESVPVVNKDASDSLLLPKESYQIDFANLDSVDPFKTGGSKIQNSPPVSRKSPVCSSSSPKPDQMSSEGKNSEALSRKEDTLSSTETPELGEVSTDTAGSVAPPTEAPTVLEFNFDDGTLVKRKPPPKCLGVKKPLFSKAKMDASRPAPEKKSRALKLQSSCDMATDSAATEIPPPRGAYTIDFDQLDNPNFNPFGAKAGTGSCPARDAPVKSDVSTCPAEPEDQDGAVETRTHGSHDPETAAEAEPSFTKQAAEEPEPVPFARSHQPSVPVIPKPQNLESAFSCALIQSTEFDSTAAADEFVPGSMFMPSDLDGQIDYLEQFGSSTFKESALRKQSLYLKFDPLLKESPKKASGDVSGSGFSLPRPSLAFRMMEAARMEVRQKCQPESTKLLEDVPPLREPPVVQDPTVLDLLVPTLKETQAQRSEDVIVDMLKYTQRDLDAALETTREQAEEKEMHLKAQIEKITLDNQQMVLIVSEFEAAVAQITAEHKQKEMLAQAELSGVLQEKQQLAKELSDIERSFSDVVKRLDRHKEVIEGFKKNEETLKQFTQSYLARLQKEEQRYQMLKTHAEDKIDQANKHIAEVHTKLGAEVSALKVQLRREQLKVQSLEKNLEQKTKEVEDVTKLCDELIAKVQQH